jgi:hypothetical protein
VGIPALLLAAAAVKIAIPAFDAPGVPSSLTQKAPEYYANGFESLQCATGLVTSRLGPSANTLFVNCDGDALCLSNLGRQFSVDFVLLGSIRKIDEQYSTDLKLVDVREQAVRRRFVHKYTGALSGLEASVKEFSGSICKVADPSWKEPEKPKSAEQLLADLQFDTGGLGTPAPKPAPKTVVKLTPVPATRSADGTSLPPVPPAEPPKVASVATPPAAPKEAEATPQLNLSPPSSSGLPSFLQPPKTGKARLATLVSFGGAAAATVVGGVFGGAALSAASQRVSASDTAAFNSAQSAAQSRATAANVAFGVAGTAAITTVVFWFAGDRIFGDNMSARTAGP